MRGALNTDIPTSGSPSWLTFHRNTGQPVDDAKHTDLPRLCRFSFKVANLGSDERREEVSWCHWVGGRLNENGIINLGGGHFHLSLGLSLSSWPVQPAPRLILVSLSCLITHINR